jgi:hypothetical protein
MILSLLIYRSAGYVFEIEAPPFGLAVRNRIAVADEGEAASVRVS